MSFSDFFMEKELTTVTVFKKDKKKFKTLVNEYDSNQQIFFGKMVRIMKQFKPELEESKKC